MWREVPTLSKRRNTLLFGRDSCRRVYHHAGDWLPRGGRSRSMVNDANPVRVTMPSSTVDGSSTVRVVRGLVLHAEWTGHDRAEVSMCDTP